MGRKGYLFLFYHALASYIAGEWDDAQISESSQRGARSVSWMKNLEKAFELANTPSLYKVLEKAKHKQGGVTVCACSTSTRLLGLEPAQVLKKVDQIVGLATMLENSSPGSQILYI
jgi:peroxiredoxin family protein